MTPLEMLHALLALAAEAGIRVSSGRDAVPPVEGGLCRVHGELWLVLVPSDPIEHQLDLAVSAIRTHAPTLLEDRWLPPALRGRLERTD